MKMMDKIKFDHLFRLTDSTGIFQHASFGIADFSKGYTTDDNSRALCVALNLFKLTHDPRFLNISETYISFLKYTQRDDGWWHNYIGYNREYLDERGSEDAFGRAFMCMSYAFSVCSEKRFNANSREMLNKAYPNILSLRSPRAISFVIIGLKYLVQKSFSENVISTMKIMSDRLCECYYNTKKPGWHWFEEIIAYSNGSLPASLFFAYSVLNEEKYLNVGLETLNFLTKNLFEKRYLKIIGNEGWWIYGKNKAEFDEQPVDAGSMVFAYKVAKNITGRDDFDKYLHFSWEWFFGKNSLGKSLYDEETGGCFDGITRYGVNENEGAESLLSLLGSYIIINI